MLLELHPADANELRLLGENLFDFSKDRSVSRQEIEHRVARIMPKIRSDFSTRGLAAVFDRLIDLADWRSGSAAMAEAAFAEMTLGHAAFAEVRP